MEQKKMIEPDPVIKERLMKAFDEKYPFQGKKTGGRFFRIINYPVPLYQAGMAASILLLIMFYITMRIENESEMVALTDTVYVEKPILIKDTVWKEREANYSVHKVTFGKQGTPQVSVETLSDRTETDFKTRQLNEAIDRIAVISTLGKERSSGRDRELLKLISVVY